MADAVFTRTGDHYLPGRHANGPWSQDRLHGGPVFGLLARAVELALPDPGLTVARLSFDLFRSVPTQPLAVRVEVLRQGSRLALLQVGLLVEGAEFARATALALRGDDGPPAVHTGALPPEPSDLPIRSLMGSGPLPPGVPPGFHSMVETRWAPQSDSAPLAIWFRLPIALIEGEPTTPLQRAVALSDFANAIASIAARERQQGALPYINVDATIYLARQPQGEWFCLTDHGDDAERGVGVVESVLSDTQGPLGRVVQARLVQRLKGR